MSKAAVQSTPQRGWPPVPRGWRDVFDPAAPWSPCVVTGSSPDLVSRSADGIVLVAAPYLKSAQVRGGWHYERSVRASTLASMEVARLASCGVTALCPAVQMAEIAHTRALVSELPDPLDIRFWGAWARPILFAARMIIVPEIDGWRECPQVWAAVLYALTRHTRLHLYAAGA